MNQYVYTLEPTRANMMEHPTDDEQAILARQATYLKNLLTTNVATIIGESTLKDENFVAMVFFLATDDAAAKNILAEDPTVQERIMRGCLFPHKMSLWNTEALSLEPNQQHYFYKIRPVRPAMIAEGATDLEGQVMGQHFMYLKDLTEKGVFAFAGPTLVADNSNFGAGLLHAESIEQAWELSQNDPAVINKVMRLDIFPFTVRGYNQHFTA